MDLWVLSTAIVWPVRTPYYVDYRSNSLSLTVSVSRPCVDCRLPRPTLFRVVTRVYGLFTTTATEITRLTLLGKPVVSARAHANGGPCFLS